MRLRILALSALAAVTPFAGAEWPQPVRSDHPLESARAAQVLKAAFIVPRDFDRAFFARPRFVHPLLRGNPPPLTVIPSPEKPRIEFAGPEASLR